MPEPDPPYVSRGALKLAHALETSIEQSKFETLAAEAVEREPGKTAPATKAQI